MTGLGLRKPDSKKCPVGAYLNHNSNFQILDVDPNEYGEEDGANVDLDSQRKGKCAVIKTSTRQTYFLPVIGLVDAETLKPGDLVGVNKDSYLILETLPAEYDSRVKAMEVDERPTEQYSDIGGLDKQIQELIEAVVLPVTHKERFENLGNNYSNELSTIRLSKHLFFSMYGLIQGFSNVLKSQNLYI